MNLVNTCKQQKFMERIHTGMLSDKMNTGMQEKTNIKNKC